MKHLTLITLFIFLSFSTIASPLTKDDIKNLSFNKLQSLRWAYITFVMEAEKDNPGVITSIFSDFSLFSAAYASPNQLCFFGGWPSVIVAGKCRKPWRKSNIAEVKAFGAYEAESYCGSRDEFRCNPVLFGSPTEAEKVNDVINGIPVDPTNSGEKGYCIKRQGTYKDLTKKCEKVSRKSVSKLVESYKKDPIQLDKFAQAIANYCHTKPNYDPCEALKKRVKEITKKELPEPQVQASTPEQTDTQRTPKERTKPKAAPKATSKTEAAAPAKRPEQSYGNLVLNQCKKLLEKEGLSKSVFSKLKQDHYECKTGFYRTMGESDNGIKDFERAAQSVRSRDLLQETNKNKLFISLYSLYANKIKFQGFKGEFLNNEKSFLKQIQKDYPHLKSEYKETIKKVFKKLNEDKKYLVPLDFDSQTKELNAFANEINKACKETYEAYQKKKPEIDKLKSLAQSQIRSLPMGGTAYTMQAGPYADAHIKYEEEVKKFKKAENEKIISKIKSLYQNAQASHLFSTPEFKENVFDPTQNAAEECMENPNYKVVKDDITTKMVNNGHNQINKMSIKAIKENNKIAKIIKKGDASRIEDTLKELVRKDPQSVLATVQDVKPISRQAPYAARACTHIVDVARSDKRWGYVRSAVGAVTLASGAVLIASGIGAPIGGAVVTAATVAMTGGSLVAGGMAYEDYAASQVARGLADRSFAQKRSSIDQYISELNEADRQKVQAYIEGGAAALGSIPAISYVARIGTRGAKAVTSAVRGSRAAAQEASAAARATAQEASAAARATAQEASAAAATAAKSTSAASIKLKEAQTIIEVLKDSKTLETFNSSINGSDQVLKEIAKRLGITFNQDRTYSEILTKLEQALQTAKVGDRFTFRQAIKLLTYKGPDQLVVTSRMEQAALKAKEHVTKAKAAFDKAKETFRTARGEKAKQAKEALEKAKEALKRATTSSKAIQAQAEIQTISGLEKQLEALREALKRASTNGNAVIEGFNGPITTYFRTERALAEQIARGLKSPIRSVRKAAEKAAKTFVENGGKAALDSAKKAHGVKERVSILQKAKAAFDSAKGKGAEKLKEATEAYERAKASVAYALKRLKPTTSSQKLARKLNTFFKDGTHTAQNIEAAKAFHNASKLPSEVLLTEVKTIAETGPGTISTLSQQQVTTVFEKLGKAYGLTEKAPKKIYRTLSQRFHPDRLGDAPAEIKALSEAEFKIISQLWDVLK